MTQHLTFSLYSHFEYNEQKYKELLEADKIISTINLYRKGPELYFGFIEKLYIKYPELIGFSLTSEKDLSVFYTSYNFNITNLNLKYEDNRDNIITDFKPFFNFLNDSSYSQEQDIFQKYYLNEFTNIKKRDERFDIYLKYIENNFSFMHKHYWKNAIKELKNGLDFSNDTVIHFNDLKASAISGLFFNYNQNCENVNNIIKNIERLHKEYNFLFMQHIFEENKDISHIFYIDNLDGKNFDFYTYNNKNKTLTNYYKNFSVIYETDSVLNIKTDLSIDCENKEDIFIFERDKMFLEYDNNNLSYLPDEDIQAFLTCFRNYQEKKTLDSLIKDIHPENKIKNKRL